LAGPSLINIASFRCLVAFLLTLWVGCGYGALENFRHLR
jgi:hypothetical protein